MTLFSFTVPPEKIHIYDDKRIDKSVLLGPYNEGSDVNLLCEVRGGKYSLICLNISRVWW